MRLVLHHLLLTTTGVSKQRVQPGGKKTAVSGGSVHVASESDPGENIGYQLARCRIEGVIVCFLLSRI